MKPGQGQEQGQGQEPEPQPEPGQRLGQRQDEKSIDNRIGGNSVQSTAADTHLGAFKFLRGRCFVYNEENPILPKTNVGITRTNFYFSKALPLVIVVVSLAEVVVHYFAEEKFKESLMYDSRKNNEMWRFLTYMLVHKDSFHLWLNVVIQGFVGFPLELEQGHCKCTTVYLAGGLAGSLGAATFSTLNLMAGASGGIYSMLTSHFANVFLNYQAMRYAWLRIVALVILSSSDVIHTTYHLWFNHNENPEIAWVVHASAAAAGLLTGLLIFEGNSDRRKQIQMISSFILIAFLTSAAVARFRRLAQMS